MAVEKSYARLGFFIVVAVLLFSQRRTIRSTAEDT